jgi:hypothetical protein
VLGAHWSDAGKSCLSVTTAHYTIDKFQGFALAETRSFCIVTCIIRAATSLIAGVRSAGNLPGREPAEGCATAEAAPKELSGFSALLGQIQDKSASRSLDMLDAPTKAAIGAAVAAVSGEAAGKGVLDNNNSQQLPELDPVHLTPPQKNRSIHSSGGLLGADTSTPPGLPFAGIATGMERIPGLGMLGSPKKAEQIQEPMPEDDLMLQDDNDDLEASLYQCASRHLLSLHLRRADLSEACL